MDRARVKDEVIEVLCKKLYRLGEINSPVADIEEKVIFPMMLPKTNSILLKSSWT